jgi:hypothetical protein
MPPICKGVENMAVTAITPEVLKFNTFDLDSLAMTAATTAADGFTIDCSGIADHKIMFVFQNSGATARTATVKKGNGIQGTADLVSGEIAASKFGTVVVESGRFKNAYGTDKGLVKIIPSHAELKMAAIVLP